MAFLHGLRTDSWFFGGETGIAQLLPNKYLIPLSTFLKLNIVYKLKLLIKFLFMDIENIVIIFTFVISKECY